MLDYRSGGSTWVSFGDLEVFNLPKPRLDSLHHRSGKEAQDDGSLSDALPQ